MASITIRNLDEQIKAQLRVTAATHGHSMEEEVRRILRSALSQQTSGGLGSRIRERFAAAGSVDLALPARSDAPRTLDFD